MIRGTGSTCYIHKMRFSATVDRSKVAPCAPRGTTLPGAVEGARCGRRGAPQPRCQVRFTHYIRYLILSVYVDAVPWRIWNNRRMPSGEGAARLRAVWVRDHRPLSPSYPKDSVRAHARPALIGSARRVSTRGASWAAGVLLSCPSLASLPRVPVPVLAGHGGRPLVWGLVAQSLVSVQP